MTADDPRIDKIALVVSSKIRRNAWLHPHYRRTAAVSSEPDKDLRNSARDDNIRKLSESASANPNQDRFAIAALTRSRHDQATTSGQMAAVRVPTLGVVGALDPALSAFKELNKLRPALKLVVIDGATHVSAFARPEFVAAVRDFIALNRNKASQ